MEKGATISQCGKYRYQLWRIWDEDTFKPKVAFIMLNQSTADGHADDPTIRRCIAFAKKWGYGGMYVLNLFAYRSTDPKELMKKASGGIDIVGPYNDTFMSAVKMQGSKYDVVFAWGSHPGIDARVRKIQKLFPEAKCIQKTKSGAPGHPLYLKQDLVPINF